MTYRHALQIGLAASTLLTMPSAQAVNMSTAEFSEMRSRISAQCKRGRAACSSMASNANDNCIASAKASFGNS